MTELITVDRRDPRCLAYLRGTFARDRRALPVRSLNVRATSEAVTFRILPLDQIGAPGLIRRWASTLRAGHFLRVLVPILFVLTAARQANGALDPDLPWLVTVALLCLHVAFSLRHDVQDHLSGFDRIREDRGSEAIRQGWLTAAEVEQAAWWLLLAGAVAALPILVARPTAAPWAAIATVLGMRIFLPAGSSFRDLPGGSLILHLLHGPVLFLGLAVVLDWPHWTMAAAGGFLWGCLVLAAIHLRDVEQLVAQGVLRGTSWMGRLGFDSALRALRFWWLGLYVGHGALIWSSRFFWVSAVWLAALGLGLAAFLVGLGRLTSPAGSQVVRFRRYGDYLVAGFTVLWLLRCL